MKKYFLSDGTAQQGPFTLEELQEKAITASTPIWYDGLSEWTTAGQLEELKDIIVHTPPPFHAPAASEEVKPAETVETTPVVAAADAAIKPAAVAQSTPATAKSLKKKTAWLSWVLYLLVFGGVGFFIYQDMEKNKGNDDGRMEMTDNMDDGDDDANNGADQDEPGDQDETDDKETGDTDDAGDDAASATDEKTSQHSTVSTVTTERPTTAAGTQPPVANTTKTNQPVVVNEKAKTNVTTTKTKPADAQKAVQQKAEEEKKKMQASQTAAALKEKEYRNNWPKYITIGKLDYTTNDDGVDAFNIPVYNGTNATLDKVTLRVDYMKKEKKVLKSETVVVYGIPAGAGLNGRAPESKKGNNVKVYITGISSRKLHFCFPVNNDNPDDPYFCN